MTKPTQFLTRMVLFLAIVGGLGAFLHEALLRMFMANAPLNGLIVGVLVIGIFYVFRQVLLLGPEVDWIKQFQKADTVQKSSVSPRLLAPMATMMGDRTSMSLSATSTRSLLDSIGSRLDESREISRYIIGLLVFLGLLGTFWGLLQTVASVGDAIHSLSMGADQDFVAMFSELQKGLEAPIGGMSTAFASSLFGLAGSLVLGFLDLSTGQAQNRFFNELEDWLSQHTRLTGGLVGDGDGGGSVPAYMEALMEQTAESMENLGRVVSRLEENRNSTNHAVESLSEKLIAMTDSMQQQNETVRLLAQSQADLRPILERLAIHEGGGNGMDEATAGHIRTISATLHRIAEEQTAGREQTLRELRADIKLLAKTVATALEGRR